MRYTPTPVGETFEVIIGYVATFRYTPTPVGKTFAEAELSKSNPVHPHACGENPDY